MSDLETRLRDHAQRPIAPPDFDAAVDAAVHPAVHAAMHPAVHAGTRATSLSATGRIHSPHRSVRTWLAAAAAVIAVAGGATALSLARGGEGHRAGAPVTRQSRTAPSDAPPSVTFTPTVVGITLGGKNIRKGGPLYMVYVTAPSAAAKNCVDLPHVHLVETAAQVRIDADVLRRPNGRILCETQGLPDPRDGALLAGLVDALKHPLGNRAIVDGRTGKPVEVFTPSYPRATYLPAGYSEALRGVDDPMTKTFSDPRPGFLAPMSVAQGFSPLHGSAADDTTSAPLVVVQAPYDTVNAGAHAVGHVSVNGHDATVTETSTTRCITWSGDNGSGIQVCSQGKQLLGEAELLRVARGLR